MNLKINDESLLATLVSETYQCVDEKEENSSNLSAYFESRMSSEVEGSNSDHFLEDKLLRSNVSFSCMSYFLETSSFHFDLKGESYTCPRNWGEFERVFSEMNDTEYKIFEYFNEDYLLNEIFKSSIDYEYETIAFCGNGESYIIFMPKENVEILNWLKKYCESSEKAA
ncbi:hypothetical protein BIY24_16005 [Halobacteriovorax marinus]|uniref:hypothetical protein n=1 Tax=Halobacteriovorax marinus TaxID=97084 RepID=UPI000BC33645|nr:hypothetical protein [Halobacteriovorax marinus]ATH09388.1 hypothetical protein BIY24_16005 [Halobacteriovorax marinus]